MKLKHLENIDKTCEKIGCDECPFNHKLYEKLSKEEQLADVMCNTFMVGSGITPRQVIEEIKSIELPYHYRKRNYLVFVTRIHHYHNFGYTDMEETSHFTLEYLDSERLKKRFENNEYRTLVECVVKDLRTKKIIYKGDNYEEYKKAMVKFLERTGRKK